MTSLASSRSSVRSIAFHYTSLALLTPSRCRLDVGSRRESIEEQFENQRCAALFKIPRGRVALHVYRTDDCDGAAGDASNELHARDNADGGVVGCVAGGKRALIRAGPESVYTAVRHDLTRK